MGNNIIDYKLLQNVFSKLEAKAGHWKDDDKKKIEAIYHVLEKQYEIEYCKKVYQIVNAEYKIIPERTREMLEGRISIHFNQQIPKEIAAKILNIIVFGYEEVSEEKDFLAKQAKGYSGFAESKTITNEVENAVGKFGYDVTNPIPINGIDMIDDYFARLTLITGESITKNRVGSTNAENLEFPVDIYEIFNTCNEKITTLFVYAYHGNMSNKAPEGFKLK